MSSVQPDSTMPVLELREIRHSAAGLDGVSLSVQAGECLAMLQLQDSVAAVALLRIAAGILRPQGGAVFRNGQNVARLAPRRRGIGLVLPASLPPDLTAGQVISLAGTAPPGLLNRLDLRAQLATRVCALAPGAAARVALAQALVAGPSLLLVHVRRGDAIVELLDAVRREAGVTLVLATVEASVVRAVADRIAVLRDGRIAQLDTVRALYDTPATPALAACLGEVNRLPGQIQAIDEDIAEIRLADGRTVEALCGEVAPACGPCELLIRPEHVAVAATRAAELGGGAVPATVRGLHDGGDHVRVTLDVAGSKLVARRPSAAGLAIGRSVAIAWQTQHARAFRVTDAKSAAANKAGGDALPQARASL